MNNNERDAKARMKNEGYEYIMEITGYDRFDTSMPFMAHHGQFLFGKTLGNITIFKVADCTNTYDIEKIGSKKIEVMTQNGIDHIEVNARYILNGVTEEYFNMPY